VEVGFGDVIDLPRLTIFEAEVSQVHDSTAYSDTSPFTSFSNSHTDIIYYDYAF
jgi:hypothetical protein